ncbi:MAG: hypothetical protein M3367_07445 [Acidobacteriota bacterium]|nr:hypothetical protein [Acidobacteriota bacterium]
MKPLQHAQISQKTHGGKWQDYIAVHSFLDSSKASCAHFKHRFLLHHREGIEFGARIFGANIINSENKTIETRQILTEHLIEDVGRIVSVEDWARDLLPNKNDSFYRFLEKKREQIECDCIPGENELLGAFNLSKDDALAVKKFLHFPLETSAHSAALLVSHNSFGVFLAEQIFGHAFVKDTNTQKQLVAVREVFERLIFLRMKAVYSPAEIVARTASQEWMRGANAGKAQEEKKRLTTD